MKFVIQKAPLLKALQHIDGAVSTRSNVPILCCAKITTHDSSISLTSTCLDIEAVDTVPAIVTGSHGAVAVPVSTMIEIVRTLQNDSDITFEVIKSGDDAYKALITSGKSKFEIVGLSADAFPKVFKDGCDSEISISSKNLLHILAKTAFSMSNNPERYNLNGILLHTDVEDGINHLYSVSTDGHRLSVSKIPLNADVSISKRILPRATVIELVKLLVGYTGDVTLMITSDKVTFVMGTVKFTTKLVDASFPEYQKVVPQKNDKMMECSRSELLRILDRVSVIHRINGVRGVKLSVESSVLTLSATNQQGDVASDELDVVFHSDAKFETCFNPKFISDVIHALSSDRICFAFHDSTSPTMMFASNPDLEKLDNVVKEGLRSPEYYVVMPMKS